MFSLKNLEKFIYFSTDEVYGSAPVGKNYKEGERFNCGNPYSASKGAAECVCQSYANTYQMPIIVTNTMNVIGERQHPEKFVPKVIRKVLAGEPITIHSNKQKTKAGSRFYIHARNIADALLHIINNCDETLDNYDSSMGRFNIVGEEETDNLELAQMIADILGKELKPTISIICPTCASLTALLLYKIFLITALCPSLKNLSPTFILPAFKITLTTKPIPF